MARVASSTLFYSFLIVFVSTSINTGQAFDLSSFVSGIKSEIVNATSEAVSNAQQVAENIDSEWQKVIGNLEGKWEELKDNASDKVSSVWDEVAEHFLAYAEKSNFNKISDDFPEGAEEEYNAGLLLEDKDLNFTQLVTKYGYVVETHEVETSDGYIVTLFRILGKSGGSPVLLTHGFTSNSVDYLTVGPDSALPYLLADQEYDVWLLNARGTQYSRKHVTLSEDSDEFWDFSWDEIGRYDLPATIDYILKETSRDKLTYIGHSQGATIFYVMCSELPEYNDKITSASLLSPLAYMGNIKSLPFWALAQITYDENSLGRKLLGPKILTNQELLSFLKKLVCSDGTSTLREVVCANVGFTLFGFDNAQINYTTLPSIVSHLLTSASTKQFEHYSQCIDRNTFKKFDYGESKNLELYGSEIAPDYQVEKITVPISIYYSEADWLATPTDIETLLGHLSQSVDMNLVDFKLFSHIDYLFAKDVKELLYDTILEKIKQRLG